MDYIVLSGRSRLRPA